MGSGAGATGETQRERGVTGAATTAVVQTEPTGVPLAEGPQGGPTLVEAATVAVPQTGTPQPIASPPTAAPPGGPHSAAPQTDGHTEGALPATDGGEGAAVSAAQSGGGETAAGSGQVAEGGHEGGGTGDAPDSEMSLPQREKRDRLPRGQDEGPREPTLSGDSPRAKVPRSDLRQEEQLAAQAAALPTHPPIQMAANPYGALRLEDPGHAEGAEAMEAG